LGSIRPLSYTVWIAGFCEVGPVFLHRIGEGIVSGFEPFRTETINVLNFLGVRLAALVSAVLAAPLVFRKFGIVYTQIEKGPAKK